MSDLNLSVEKAQGRSLRGPMILSGISLLLMIVQSGIGLFMPGTYANDPIWGRATFQGNDLINLFLFTPLLIIALILLKRGSDKGKVFWLGIQALITYDYIYYPLGVKYNNYFLLYILILGISLYSFIFGILGLDLSKYQKYIPGKSSKITASVLLLAFTLVFLFLWVGKWVSFIMNGSPDPSNGGLDLNGVAMVSTFDLITLAVPLVLSAIWLLKGEGRGYALSIVMGLVCGLYSFILIAYTPLALKANLPDAWTMLPLWVFTAVLGLSPAVILLISRRST